MHLEKHLRENPKDLKLYLTKLQQVYGALDEPDYVYGLASIRGQRDPTLEELIHHHQVTGNFQDALACYESLGKSNNESLELKSGMLRCYLEMDQPHTTSMVVKGLVERDPDLRPSLRKYQVEAAWQLGQWDAIETNNNSDGGNTTEDSDWSVSLGKIMSKLNDKDSAGLHTLVSNVRREQIIPISAAAMEQGSYRRCYEYVVRLQILDEVEALSKTLDHGEEALDQLFNEWKTRTAFSQYSLANLEPVLRVRRGLLNVALNTTTSPRLSTSSQYSSSSKTKLKDKLKNELSEVWLLSAKAARKAGQLNKAYNLLLEAQKFSHKEIFIERAKLSWARSDKTEAINTLEKGIHDHFPQLVKGFDKKVIPGLVKADVATCSKAKLLLAKYVDDAATKEPDAIPSYYNEAKALAPDSEDVFYYSAMFFDKVIGKNYKTSDLDSHGDVVSHIIMQYARSLSLGCAHLHQSMPRLLSLWLDYGSRISELEAAVANSKGKKRSSASSVSTPSPEEILKKKKAYLDKINDTILKFSDKCPTYYFLTVFPQLTSRICHDNSEVWSILKHILYKTFLSFPHHVFWHMVALSKSSYDQRASRAKQIFDLVKNKLGKGAKLIEDGLLLADRLVQLSDEKLSSGEESLRKVFPPLSRLVMAKNFSKILLPTTMNMTVALPTNDGRSASFYTHNPFPNDLVYLHGIEDSVVVMRSLVQPKKVTFRGSDGKTYSFLCKPKDDLRRDCRLLDFNNLLNKLFMKDPESRKRNLHIRTYVS